MTTTTAVLFADRNGEELAPLNSVYPTSLIPVAGKTPLEFWFEHLCVRGYKEVHIVTSAMTKQVKDQFPDGDHWGLNFTYHSSRGEELPSTLVERIGLELPFFAARGDTLPCFEDNQLIAALEVDNETNSLIDNLAWSMFKEINSEWDTSLSSLQGLYEATFNVLNSKHTYLVPRGLRAEDGKWVATPTFSSARAHRINGALYVGRDSMVEPDAHLDGNVVVEANSYVDRNTKVTNSIILPGTYVGQDMSVKESIVCGSTVIDLKHSNAIQISDPALFSFLVPSAAIVRTTMTERLVAALVMLVTAPIILPLALIAKRGKFILTELAYSNRGSRAYPLSFELYRFNSRLSSINHWPRLLHVIDGELKLFGSKLESDELQAPIDDLPLCQGVIAPSRLKPNYQFDEIEEQLWGFELANEKKGFFASLFKTIRAAF